MTTNWTADSSANAAGQDALSRSEHGAPAVTSTCRVAQTPEQRQTGRAIYERHVQAVCTNQFPPAAVAFLGRETIGTARMSHHGLSASPAPGPDWGNPFDVEPFIREAMALAWAIVHFHAANLSALRAMQFI